MNLVAKKKGEKTIFECSCCGKEYGEIDFCFGNGFPDYYYSIPPEERDKRVEITESLCIVDETHFFHRGRLTIPINNYEQNVVFNVWASISEENFFKRNDLWNNPKRVNEEPYFGWFQTLIPTYGDTINIKSIAIENEAGLIPTIRIIEENHPLKIDQQNGISFERALQIADIILTSGHEDNQ